MTGRRWVRGGVGSGSLRPQLKAGYTGSVSVGVPVPSLSPTMGMRGVARILSLSLVLAAVATGAWERGPLGVLLPWQGSAALGRCCPGRDPMFVARGPPRCFCDQACGAARDCCADYKRVCPGAPGERQGTSGTLGAEGSWGGG